jgi:hypothetical protein
METPLLLAYESHLPGTVIPWRRAVIVGAGAFGARHATLGLLLCFALPYSFPVVALLLYTAWRYFSGLFDLLRNGKGVIARLQKTAMLFTIITGVAFGTAFILVMTPGNGTSRESIMISTPRISHATFDLLGFLYFGVVEGLWTGFLFHLQRRQTPGFAAKGPGNEVISPR